MDQLMYQEYKDKIEQATTRYHVMQGEKNSIEKDIKSINYNLVKAQVDIDLYQKVQHLLNIVSTEARDKAKQLLEQTVTSAINFVSPEAVTFEIEMTTLRGKPACEFYVITTVNGEESRQKPQDSCGGGFVDIISTALRYAYINIFSDPVIGNAIVLDEPGKMVSEMAAVKFAEFTKSLGQSFDRQTIMVTHNDNLINIADHVKMVTKINDTSNIQNYTLGGMLND